MVEYKYIVDKNECYTVAVHRRVSQELRVQFEARRSEDIQGRGRRICQLLNDATSTGVNPLEIAVDGQICRVTFSQDRTPWK